MDVLTEFFCGVIQVSRDRALGDLTMFLTDVSVARRLRQEYSAIAVVKVEERFAEVQQKRLPAP